MGTNGNDAPHVQPGNDAEVGILCSGTSLGGLDKMSPATPAGYLLTVVRPQSQAHLVPEPLLREVSLTSKNTYFQVQ